jgi:hypothetical protein
MENTKKHSKKKHDILRLFGEGSIEKIKNHETTKKTKRSKKSKKSKTIDPMGHHVTRVQT